jgi:formylglycine-generating enzyme required for sulfatase activity
MLMLRWALAGFCFFTVVLGWCVATAQAVSIDWVTVGDPGNPGDPQESCEGCGPGTTFGSVAYVYQISKFEVTNAQYAEFLNAVAATDTYAIYDTSMSSGLGGIKRSGFSGNFTYTTIAGRENMAVNFVSFWHSLRFANWLENGQPTGTQDSTTTEDGAYTITPAGVADNSITSNVGATFFIPSEDEWYKAAYYDPRSKTYFEYPAASNTPTSCAQPGTTANTANCSLAVDDVTIVGSYTGSASPNGTFDQGGNVAEWNEAITPTPSHRGLRGGSWGNGPGAVAASFRGTAVFPGTENAAIGFRVVRVPEPSTNLLCATALICLAAYRTRRPSGEFGPC